MCRHEREWGVTEWPDNELETMHERQSDPGWVRNMLAGQYGSDIQRIQTYRLAVRQELRKRGLAVRA